MHIIANENVGGPVVETLRERGHNVVWVKETMRGARDEEVLARAQSDRRLVVTLDKDFGELAFHELAYWEWRNYGFPGRPPPWSFGEREAAYWARCNSRWG